jgi:hypothetical protein
MFCAFAAVLMALTVTSAAQAAEKGLSTDLTWGTSAADQARTAAVVQDSGARWALITVSWRDVERAAKNDYDPDQLAQVDQAVSGLRQVGVNVIATVAATPPWASAGGTRWDPPNPSDYADFMTFLANRYKGQVAAYEIWNEPDISPPRFWNGGPDAAAYAALLKAAYPAVKAGDPNARVLFGGTQFNDYKWLEDAYAAEPSLGSYFDVMATHPYPPKRRAPEEVRYCTEPGMEWCSDPPDGRMSKDSFPAYREVRKTLLAHGDDKPIWFTEVGWSTAASDPWGVSEETQADYLTRAYRYIEADPYVQVAVWYSLRNNWFGYDGSTWDDQLGLLRTDFTPKPSWYAFRGLYRQPDPFDGGGTAGGTATSPTGSSKQPTTTTVAVRLLPISSRRRLARRPSRAVVLSGRVRNAAVGTVRTVLQRRWRNGRWHNALFRTRRVDRLGRFTVNAALHTPGRWRVRSTYKGAGDRLASSSRWRSFVLSGVQRRS